MTLTVRGAFSLGLAALALSMGAFAATNLNSSRSNVYREAGCAGYPQDAKCCKAAGGTWVTAGDRGFCYLNLKTSGLGLTENDCKAAGGVVEQKSDGPACAAKGNTVPPAN